jgi:hypothetical protein
LLAAHNPNESKSLTLIFKRFSATAQVLPFEYAGAFYHAINRGNAGDDVSRFFTNKGEMKPPVKRVNVDFTPDMLKELDAIAKELNVSRQAVIKTYLRQALDQHYIARQTQG